MKRFSPALCARLSVRSFARGMHFLGWLFSPGLIAALLACTPARAFDDAVWTLPYTGTGSNNTQLAYFNNTGNGMGIAGRSKGGVGVYGSSANGTGVSGDATTQGSYGVVGYNYATTGVAHAIYGVTTANNGIGVIGSNTSTAQGLGVGVYGLTTSPGASGVIGINSSLNGFFQAGVFGTAGGQDLFGVAGRAPLTGVYGSTTDTTAGTGVRGQSVGTNGIGVEGRTPNGGANASGVYGISEGHGIYGESVNGFAGYFQGKVTVTGTLTAAVKNFKIDDPRDPAHRYLVHASVESDQMQNLYSGKVLLDTDGKAVVQLPSYCEPLNEDFQYQLTAIGAAAPDLHIAEEVKDGRFTIAGGKPGLKVCWQVTGVRHDPYAEAHPLQVEQEKTGLERGHYLNPELYGKPRRMREHAIAVPRHVLAGGAGPSVSSSLLLPPAPARNGVPAIQPRN